MNDFFNENRKGESLANYSSEFHQGLNERKHETRDHQREIREQQREINDRNRDLREQRNTQRMFRHNYIIMGIAIATLIVSIITLLNLSSST